jgi:dolichol-phosphate mannosyltransferase
MLEGLKTAVVIPCYNIPNGLDTIILSIPEFVDIILIIDDACPKQTVFSQLSSFNNDARVLYHRNNKNEGVGGSFYQGYLLAKENNCSLIAKLDGDSQHTGHDLERYFKEIIERKADFIKGNRFYSSQIISKMPLLRLIGNSLLSFLCKMNSGYWTVMDPTFGKFATSIACLDSLNWKRIGRRYTFETTLLCALSIEFVKILQLRELAVYGNETSGLKPAKLIFPLLKGLIKLGIIRVIHQHFLRSFSLLTFLLPIWLVLLPYTIYFVTSSWADASRNITYSAPGTVAISLLLTTGSLILPLIILILDMINEPKRPQNFLEL